MSFSESVLDKFIAALQKPHANKAKRKQPFIVWNVPAEKVKEFEEKVVEPHCGGDISKAILVLMESAIKEAEKKEN